LVGELIGADDKNFDAVAAFWRAQEGVGSNLKPFRANFLEAHLSEISKLPISVQTKIHEFRNQLHILNQDIAKADEYQKMTFNTSLTELNHKRVTEDLGRLYNYIQNRCRVVADRIGLILSSI
jgi:uncharacterized protein YfkK (UPF0435 family)